MFSSLGESMSKSWNSVSKSVSNTTKSMQDRSGVSYALAQADIFDRTKGYNINKPKLESVSYNNITGLTQNKLNKSKIRLSENNLKNFTSNSNKQNNTASPEFIEEFKASTLKGRLSNTFEKTKLTTELAKIKNNYTKSLKLINEITELIKKSYNNKKLFQSSCVDLETKKKQLEQSMSLDTRVVERYKKEINAIFTKLYDTSKAVIKSNKDIQDIINSLKKLSAGNEPIIGVFLDLLDNNIIDYTRMYTEFFQRQEKNNKEYPYTFTVNPVLTVSRNNLVNSTKHNNSEGNTVVRGNAIINPLPGNEVVNLGSTTVIQSEHHVNKIDPTEGNVHEIQSGGNKKTKTKSSVKKTKAKKDKKTKKVKKTK